MKISDFISRDGYRLSFEVFPPKSDTALENVTEATEKIAALHPSFVSVTYGAGGGTSKYTVRVAGNIQKKYGVPALAHLTCVSSSRELVRAQIEMFKEEGINNIMALRGDLTPDIQAGGTEGLDFRYASELISEIKLHGDFCIGGACYPEIHPESANQREDIRHLKEKVDAGCDFLTTQMFFDNALLYNFLYKIREAGIRVPVIAGIMPITGAKQVERAVRLSGSFMPRRFLSLVDRFGDSPDAMRQAGIAYATDQIIDLYANGINNVHVYTMNRPDVAGQ
ncbi:MAG: methylenetetrahydrofolate reductase [NAD(P)H], partial [Clostridia bacterium]|nr:methylenetetrahydrofolate reductase [NAD(P)H] [Clostridia bacterium]